MDMQDRAIRGMTLFLLIVLVGFFCLSAWALEVNQGKGQTDNSSSAAVSQNDNDSPGVQEQEAPAKIAKKHFPWFWVAAGTVVAGVVLYFTVIKKPEYKLTVSIGAGCSGSPVAGMFVYKKGKKVRYLYGLDYGYRDLRVTLDGQEVSASGEFDMDRDHVLAIASEEQFYGLTVTASAGITGTPAAGTYNHKQGANVAYSYSLAAGYSDLKVKLDGVQVVVQGTVRMDAEHKLEASAEFITTPKFDIRGTWRITRTPCPDLYDPLEVVFTGETSLGKVYYHNGSSVTSGNYTVVADQAKFAFGTAGSHFSEFAGTIVDGNNMEGNFLRHPCDHCSQFPGTFRAIRIP